MSDRQPPESTCPSTASNAPYDRGPEEKASTPTPSVLYFGNDWAAENRTSSHHLARGLARGYQVYYLECPGLRAPKGSVRDLRKVWAKLIRFLRGPNETPEGVKVWTLLQLPLHRFRFIRWFNKQLMHYAVRWLARKHKLRSPIAWFMLPHLSSLVGRLHEQLAVYYCIDDYSALPDVNEVAIREMDEEMTRKADIVFVASATLLEAKRQLNPHVYVSPHGVDLEHFARARDGTARLLPDINDLPRPVIGFFGLIEKWIDLGLVSFLAEQRPSWSFVMIGRVAVPQNEVPNRPNIHYLGTRSYDQLPDYGSQFDVAIIPYHLTRQVMNANPIKLREYLAMGKPVVSVSTPEIDKYADVVRIAHTREEYLAHLDAAVAEGYSVIEATRRVERVVGEGWEARLEEVMRTVQLRLAQKIAGAK